MTQPMGVSGETTVDTVTVTTVQELISYAKKFGLTWDLRIARVVHGDQPTNITAVLDGDLVQMPMVSLIGKIQTDQRVYVMVVPPAGYFIIGWTGSLNPAYFDSLYVNGVVDIHPVESSSAVSIRLNHGYELYADNTGPGSANSRVWLNGPDQGAVYIGPRTGASTYAGIFLKTSATTGSAANCFIDASNYQIRRSTSSRAYKVNVRDADVDTSKILQLRPVVFQDKNDYAERGDNATWHVGLIAEEVHDLGLHEFVHYRRSELGEPIPDGVQYDRLVPALIEVIRELKSEINTINERLDRLERSN